MSKQGETSQTRDDGATSPEAANAAESGGTVCEVMFYHLTRQPLEQVLPLLLHKTLQRKMRALVRCGNPLRMQALSDAIWTWRDDAFIPHGTLQDGHEAMQPVLMMPAEGSTEGSECAPNGARFLFCVEGAAVHEQDFTQFERICVLFADVDAAGKEQARDLWRALKDRKDLRLTYWQQEPRGGWERKA